MGPPACLPWAVEVRRVDRTRKESCMFVKWMICEVDETQRAAFRKAQIAWRQIHAVAGFVAQVGGWSTAGREACILAFWQDRSAYECFFRFVHDAVTYKSGQVRTYHRMKIAFADGLIRMRGAGPTLAAAAREARLLRVADCRVRRARRNHFVDAQLNVWEPGMAECAGQLGGMFSVVEDTEDRFLVTTLWRDEDSHDRYVRDELPRLKDEARPEGDLRGIVGRKVRLEREWTVLSPAVECP